MDSINIDRYSFKFDDIDVIYPKFIKCIKVCDKEYYDFKTSVSLSNFSRKYQLDHRSTQAKLFDLLIDAGYFNLIEIDDEIIKEMVLINTRPDIDNSRSYYLLDYFIPSKSLCIELDSDLHNPDRDELKDKFLNSLGIEVLRVREFDINTKFKLDQIITWIKSKPIKKFEINYSSLIFEYEEYLKNKAINKLKEVKGELYFIRDKWYGPIRKLCEYNPELETALRYGMTYKFQISLNDIFKLIPVSRKEVNKYRYLISQLKGMNIELNIVANKFL